MKKGFCSAASLSGSAALPFVISTEAKRSGEISLWMLFLGNVCLAERSVVEEPAVSFPGTHADSLAPEARLCWPVPSFSAALSPL
jgi:hypothetical protein